jgi:hypothetical protein
MGLPEANASGPKESRKHQGPTRRLWLRGRRRWIGSPLGLGTSLACEWIRSVQVVQIDPSGGQP